MKHGGSIDGHWPTTTLVVPCYNEATRLDVEAYSAAASNRPWLQFLFVDDGSTDATREVLEGLCEELGPQARLVPLDRNRGKAEAVRQGMLTWVRVLGEPTELVGYWDADLATPLDAVENLSSALSERGAMLAMASRVRLLGRTIERNPMRHYLGRVFATAASLSLDLPVYDTQCGAKLFHRSAPIEEIFREPFSSRWIFDVEVIGRLLVELGDEATGLIVEVPLERWTDVAGSKVRAKDFLRAALELARVAVALSRRRRQRR